MTKGLEGNYRFLIPNDKEGLIVGIPSAVNNPNHREIAEKMGSKDGLSW